MRLWLDIQHTGGRICHHLNLMSRTSHLSKFEALNHEILRYSCSCAAAPRKKICVFTSDNNRFIVSKANYMLFLKISFVFLVGLTDGHFVRSPNYPFTVYLVNLIFDEHKACLIGQRKV